MDVFTILMLTLIVLALGGWSFGYASAYATGPPGMGTAPVYNAMGVLAVSLMIGLWLMYISGVRLGIDLMPR